MNALKTSLLATALCLGFGAAPAFAEDAAKPERTAAQVIDEWCQDTRTLSRSRARSSWTRSWRSPPPSA